MFEITCTLNSLSPLTFGQMLSVPKERNETYETYEQRIWQERAHYNEEGNVVIPGVMFKNALAAAAKYRAEKIPGKMGKTWSGKFTAGVHVRKDVDLGIIRDGLGRMEGFFKANPSKKTDGTRVFKIFPMVKEWEREMTALVIDPDIDLDTYLVHLRAAGTFVGLGTHAPRSGSSNGMFEVIKVGEPVYLDR